MKRVYGIDPLVCPTCSSTMRVIPFIHDQDVIDICHLDHWDPPAMSFADRVPQRTVIYDEDIPAYDEIDEPP